MLAGNLSAECPGQLRQGGLLREDQTEEAEWVVQIPEIWIDLDDLRPIDVAQGGMAVDRTSGKG